jgi:hypothetical protein
MHTIPDNAFWSMELFEVLAGRAGGFEAPKILDTIVFNG